MKLLFLSSECKQFNKHLKNQEQLFVLFFIYFALTLLKVLISQCSGFRVMTPLHLILKPHV